jgi:ABC-type Mn2+/Zn2+ transport system permease subunit
MQDLLSLLNYEFMRHALLSAMIIGAVTGLTGSFVVIRGMSFFGEALGHSVLPGVAAAYIYSGGANSVPLFIGALSAGIISALGIGWLTRGDRVKEDSAIGIVYIAMFALGIALITGNTNAQGTDLTHILFGDILGISREDLLITFACSVVVFLITLLFFKELTIISFDMSLARTLKLPAEGLRLLLLVLIAVSVVASIQVIGTALMLALLVIPATTAQLLSKRLNSMIILSMVIGILGSSIGIFVSYYLDIATGPAVVLILVILFALGFGWSRLVGTRF